MMKILCAFSDPRKQTRAGRGLVLGKWTAVVVSGTLGVPSMDVSALMFSVIRIRGGEMTNNKVHGGGGTGQLRYNAMSVVPAATESTERPWLMFRCAPTA